MLLPEPDGLEQHANGRSVPLFAAPTVSKRDGLVLAMTVWSSVGTAAVLDTRGMSPSAEFPPNAPHAPAPYAAGLAPLFSSEPSAGPLFATPPLAVVEEAQRPPVQNGANQTLARSNQTREPSNQTQALPNQPIIKH